MRKDKVRFGAVVVLGDKKGKVGVGNSKAKDVRNAIRKAIEEFQPDVFIAGHIHEAEGLSEKIGKTRVYNVGRKGRIIEL